MRGDELQSWCLCACLFLVTCIGRTIGDDFQFMPIAGCEPSDCRRWVTCRCSPPICPPMTTCCENNWWIDDLPQGSYPLCTCTFPGCNEGDEIPRTPASVDDVFLGDHEVVLMGGTSINSLHLSGNGRFTKCGAGSLVVTATATFDGEFFWAYGELHGIGGVTNANGGLHICVPGTLDCPADTSVCPSGTVASHTLIGRTLNNWAEATWITNDPNHSCIAGICSIGFCGAQDAPAVFNNMSGATFEIRGDGLFLIPLGCPNDCGLEPGVQPCAFFHNAGTVKKTAGSANSFTTFGNVAFTNSGTVELEMGRARFFTDYRQTAGTTILAAGTDFIIPNNYALTLDGGNLTGEGTIRGNETSGLANVVNCSGKVMPGSPLGTLTIQGNYTQGCQGKLATQLGGDQCDTNAVLVVSGEVSLEGELQIMGCQPPIGAEFDVMMAGAGISGAIKPLDGWAVTYVSLGGGAEALRVQKVDGTPSLITSSNPPDLAIDARQPHAINNMFPAQGIKLITLTFSGVVTGLTSADFEIMIDPIGGPLPSILSVTPQGNNEAVIELQQPIPPGKWTRIRHVASNTSTRIGFLPADANNDRIANPVDILKLIDHLNGVESYAMYQTDIDRSGVTNPADILRLIDLLNGADAFIVWNGKTLPNAPGCQ